MPDGRPWLTRPPALRTLAVEPVYWHLYNEAYGPLAANPYSRARLALCHIVEGRASAIGMFYLASDLAGALWETVLRYVEPDPQRHVRVDIDALKGQRAVRVRLRNDAVPLLELGQPGLRALFAADSADSVAVAAILANPDHDATHEEARALRQDLARHGIDQMPVLSWPSRQHSASTVYLAYAPPMTDTWWEVEGEPVLLDTAEGYALVRGELARCGYHWDELESDAMPPPEEE